METSASVSPSTVEFRVPSTPITAEKELVGGHPEILANPPLPNTKLLFSIPVYNEWRSGHFLRNVQAILSQRVEKMTSIEVNYVLNTGSIIINDIYTKTTANGEKEIDLPFIEAMAPKAAEVYKDSQATREFIKKVQYVQRTKLFADKEGRQYLLEELKKEIEAEDPIVRNILKLAMEKADSIAISAIDTTRSNVFTLGYPVSPIAAYRTIGLDYASKRLDSKDSVFFMYDCDTIPDTNGFSNRVIDFYEKNPDLTYLFVGLGYQVPGINKKLVTDSPVFSLSLAGTYNLNGVWDPYPGSPQISFRIRAAEDIGDISGEFSGNEDFDTAQKLMNVFSDSQKRVLQYRDMAIVSPVSLTSDRDGSVDGKGRLARVATADDGDLDYAQLAIAESSALFNDEIEKIADPEEKQQFLVHLQKAREIYAKKQQMQLRMQRETASAFMKAWKEGIISKNEEGIQTNEEALLKIPCGKVLLHFIHYNKELISQLTDQDREYIKYLLGKRTTFPEDIDQLTPFQKSLREYFGEFTRFSEIAEYTSQHKEDLDGFRTKEDKRAILPGLMTELYSVGFTSFLGFTLMNSSHAGTITKGSDAYNVNLLPYELRSKWINKLHKV